MSGTQPPVPAAPASRIDGMLPSLDDDTTEASSLNILGSRRGLGKWRRPVGLLLLLATVFLWTASNFLQSTIFADNTYSKPFFVTYVNSAFFVTPLAPVLAWRAYRQPDELRQWWKDFSLSLIHI